MLRTSQINCCHAAGDRALLMAHRQPRDFCRLARVVRRFGDNSNFLVTNGLRLVSPKTCWGDTRRHATELAPRRPRRFRRPSRVVRCCDVNSNCFVANDLRFVSPKARQATPGDTRQDGPPRQQSPRTSSLFLFPLAPTRSVGTRGMERRLTRMKRMSADENLL